MRPIRFVPILLYCLLIPVALRAQNDSILSRMVVSAGVGGGWTRVSCAICRSERNLGPTGYLRIATPVASGVLLGAELNAWTREQAENGREWAHAIAAVAYLYPRPANALYVKGGLGWVGYRAEDELSTRSLGVQLGAGYEFRVGNQLYITNYLNLMASSFGSLRAADARVVDDVSVTLLQFGVGLTRR